MRANSLYILAANILIGLGCIFIIYAHIARLIMPSAYIAVGLPLSELETVMFYYCDIGFLSVVLGMMIKIWRCRKLK